MPEQALSKTFPHPGAAAKPRQNSESNQQFVDSLKAALASFFVRSGNLPHRSEGIVVAHQDNLGFLHIHDGYDFSLSRNFNSAAASSNSTSCGIHKAVVEKSFWVAQATRWTERERRFEPMRNAV